MSNAFRNISGDYMLELNDEIFITANAVAKLEQERIIEIIETCPRTDNNRTIDAPMLIELIKGEQK